MKHFTLLIGFLSLLTWQGNSQILNQAASWPNAAWTISGTYSVANLLANPTTIDANFSYDDDAAGSGSTDIILVESPLIDLTAASVGGDTWVNVDYDYDYNLGNIFNLEWYDADAAMWVVWEALPDNSGLTSGWCAAVVAPIVTSGTLDISAFTATQLSGFRYRFNYDASSTWGWGFCVSSPTIYSAAPPTCLDPSALTAINITSTGADLGWTDNAGAGLSNIEYGAAGFVLGTGTQILGTANNPESITGLTAATMYEFYIQTDCGGAGTSTWVGPFSFTTSFQAPLGVTCGVGFATMIFSDDMETGIGWTGNIGTAAGQWDYPTAFPGGNSSSTGPSGPASGTTYAEYEASGSQALASMVTPMIDLSTGSSAAELSFFMHAYGAEIGTLNVGVGTSATGPFATEFSWTGQYQTSAAQAWEQIGVDLTAYLGQQIYIEFSYAATGPNFYGDMAIDLVQVETCITCPAPSPFNLVLADTNSAEFAWTENGAATEWELEWGIPGFVPGTGSTQLTIQNPDSLVGLTPNSFYEVYLQSVCAPGDTSAIVGPITFNTYNQGQYMEYNSDCPTAGFIDISTTGTATGLPDDGEVGVALPFALLYQGYLINDVTIAENGGLLLGTQAGILGFGNGTMAGAVDGLYPFWDDLDASNFGDVYYETIGTSPSQTFIVQWEDQSYWNGGSPTEVITYQIQIEEATNEIYFVYADSEFGGSDVAFDNGASATIGAAGANQDLEVSFNSPTYLENNTCAHFFYSNCPAPVAYSVTYTTNDEAAITWSAGLAGETNWTVIYGPTGFDPLVSGNTFNTVSPAAIFPGLDDITTYDVYIYADCDPGVLQSTDAFGQFTTLPNCSDITGLAGTSATDSIFSSWSWVESDPMYPSTGFNLQYGMNGFGLYDGSETIVNADNNFSDTTVNAALLAGGVYDVYVQSLCTTDTSNWVGPVQVIMPLDNDSTCFSEDLMVDGTVYIFNNAGGTVDANETTIAPPGTGCSVTDGWCNSNLSFTTWFTFTAPASGNMRIDGSDIGFDGQIAVYEVTDCGDFATYTLVGANDDAIGGGSAAPNFTLCGLTAGNTYYLMHDSYSTFATGTYSIKLTSIDLEAGSTNGIVNVCLGDTVDLYNGIAGYDMGGVWTEMLPTANFADPLFPSAGLASQVFDFEYRVVDGCAYDTIMQQVEIYGPSSAGNDGTLTVCLNQPYDLYGGLSGNVDTGGDWYDPSNNIVPSLTAASNIPGQFNYDYITNNGVCPNDTANVVVTVDGGCDFLGINEEAFENMSLYPNPTNGSVFINNNGSNEVFNYVLTDVNGREISSATEAINGTEVTEVSLDKLVTGFYLIRVYNDDAQKTFRIIKE